MPTPARNPVLTQGFTSKFVKTGTESKPVIDFDDRRAKGLCFWCPEKYVRGHHCKKKELFSIEVIQLEEDEEGIEQNNTDDEQEASEIDNPQISVYAIDGALTKGYQTMRVTVYVNKRPLNILIDSGSTHNFLDVHIARRLGCKIDTVNPMKVDVANGNTLHCISVCKNLSWTLQGTLFTTDVLFLPLGSCDMVLRV